jgi:DNA-binding transcriptional regulator YiaG
VVDDDGFIRTRRVILPEGLSQETLNSAVNEIAAWEDGDESPVDLALTLFRLFEGSLHHEAMS